MSPLREPLPPVKLSKKTRIVAVNVPPYLNRQGFNPRKIEDFGDGGAFPEILVVQFPLEMGMQDSKTGLKILSLSVDGQGNVAFDAIVRQNENAKKVVYSQHRDLIPKVLKGDFDDEIDLDEGESQKEINETMEATKVAIEEIVGVKLSAAQPKSLPKQSSEAKFIKYQPSEQSVAFNSGAKERIIRMVETPVDPLEPPKFKHKWVPKGSGSPLVPVMHSPPRPLTVKDQQNWNKIPPCISNWKNPKGYTIPLDKRLPADGRGLQEVQINDDFVKLSESLYVAEQKAREAVAMRSKVQKEMAMKEKEKRDHELRALAAKARSERIGVVDPMGARNMDIEKREEILERDKIRDDRRRTRESERRLEANNKSMGKKSKITRDRDREISEKVALGMASVGSGKGEVMYDQRLFNQEKGMTSGFDTDDQYNIYDKGLFTSQATLSTHYQPKKDNVDADMYGGADEQLEKIKTTKRFKPDRAFTGTSETAALSDTPVEVHPTEETDFYGLAQFVTEVKEGTKFMDRVDGEGTMSASGSSFRDGNDGVSGRSRINFERGN